MGEKAKVTSQRTTPTVQMIRIRVVLIRIKSTKASTGLNRQTTLQRFRNRPIAIRIESSTSQRPTRTEQAISTRLPNRAFRSKNGQPQGRKKRLNRWKKRRTAADLKVRDRERI